MVRLFGQIGENRVAAVPQHRDVPVGINLASQDVLDRAAVQVDVREVEMPGKDFACRLGMIQMKFRKSISVAAVAALGLAANAAGKKLIAHGWDTALLTPGEILANAERFDGSPFDGLGVTLPGNDRVMTDAGWTKERFAADCETLRAAVRHPSLRESLLMINLAPQVHLAWTDDAAWARAAANLRAAGAIAKAAGLRGIMGDIEDYWKTRQFLHRANEMPYAAAAALAHRRGQEVYRGLFEEYPDMLLLTFMYFTLDRAYSISADPAATMREKGDLLPAFLNGMLDVMPAGVRVVDGNETSGTCEGASCRNVGRSGCGWRCAAGG